MSTIDWGKLAEPFPDNEIKQRPGPGGRTLSYVDARAVAQRLDDVLTPAGWSFHAEVAASDVVKGSLVIGGVVREDIGYPNSDDDAEPYKSAVSDALKRCAVLFGVGRHLYDDNKNGHRGAQNAPGRPTAARVAPRPTQPTNGHDDPYGDSLIDADGLTPIEATVRDDDTTCSIHGAAWKGTPGDLYHKLDEGGYCRHPENVRKPARAR